MSIIEIAERNKEVYKHSRVMFRATMYGLGHTVQEIEEMERYLTNDTSND